MPRNVLKGGHGFFTRRGLNIRAYKDAVKAELRAEHSKMADELIPEFEKRVSDWSGESRPSFSKRVYSSNIRRSGFGIYAGGSKHQKMLWEMIDKGAARGKWIDAKIIRASMVNGKMNAVYKRMRFREQYFGKTRPIDQFGKRPTRRGKWQAAKAVRLGPIEAREFTVSIMNEKVRRQFLDRSRQAYERAFKKAKRANE